MLGSHFSCNVATAAVAKICLKVRAFFTGFDPAFDLVGVGGFFELPARDLESRGDIERGQTLALHRSGSGLPAASHWVTGNG